MLGNICSNFTLYIRVVKYAGKFIADGANVR